MNYEHISTESVEGFEIRFSVAPEDTDPRGCFDHEFADEIVQKINDGVYDWFIARVSVYRDGVELAAEHLGGCCYEQATDFLECPYYDDMKTEALRAARAAVAKLSEGLA